MSLYIVSGSVTVTCTKLSDRFSCADNIPAKHVLLSAAFYAILSEPLPVSDSRVLRAWLATVAHDFVGPALYVNDDLIS
jgi:hypothetical protein